MNAKSEITDLTICRAAFAAWVFTYHLDLYLNFSAWLGPFAGLIRHGYLGVDGFFLRSGLILAQAHPELSRSTAGAYQFLGRRLARIYPGHLAIILIFGVVFLAGAATGHLPRDAHRFAFAPLLQNLLLVQDWGFSGQGAWNYPSWSVSAEWAGYLLFPLLWRITGYFEWYVAIQVAIAAFTLLGLIATWDHHTLNLSFGQGLLRFFPEFVIGLSTARFLPRWADNAPIRSFLAAGVALILIGTCTGADLAGVLGIWALLIAFAMQSDAGHPPVLGHRPLLNRLGRLSYAFYMSFAVPELLLTQWFREQSVSPASHGFIFAAGMLIITLFLAVTLHVTVEIPCRRAIGLWFDRARAPGAVGLVRDPL